MSISRQEEIIATLWIIAAVLAFGFSFTTWGWIFAAKGVFDTAVAVKHSISEIREEASK